MRRLWMGALLSLLAACAPAPTSPSPTIAPVLQGQVAIQFPSDSSTIYAEILTVRGSAEGIPAAGFWLRLEDGEGALVAQARVHPVGEAWQANLLHGYNGDPSEMTLRAIASDPRVAEGYDAVTIALAPLARRPDGVYGSIQQPQAEAVLGGESIPVSGRVSGAQSASVQLQRSDGALISEVLLPIANPLDDLAWQVNLSTQGLAEPARVVLLADGNILQTIPILLSAFSG